MTASVAWDTPPLIVMDHISKRFGSLWANKDVSLQVFQGEIHGVVGENGAGKSTLMKILYGHMRPDSGRIYLREKLLDFHHPKEALRAGIGMVHQQLLIFPQLTAMENIVLGFEPSRWGCMDPAGAREKLQGLCESFGFQLPLDEMAKELSFAHRQQIELLRILYRDVRVLILDEPTSLLAPSEVAQLLRLLTSLQARGYTILFISHRLNEIFAVADRISVLRGGRWIRTFHAAQTSQEEVIKTIVAGDPISLPLTDVTEKPADTSAKECSSLQAPPFLELRNVAVEPSGHEVGLEDLSLRIERGEIFGLGAVVGNGERTLARAIAGAIPLKKGHIFLGGNEVTSLSIRKRARCGLRWLPANVVEEALLPHRSLWENCLLGRQQESSFQSKGWLSKKRIAAWSETFLQRNRVSYSQLADPLTALSGGNQQRIALGRVLEGSPVLVLLEQASRGLDIRAQELLSQRIRTLSEEGVTFLLFSYDLDELLSLSHRIGILYRGRLMGIVERNRASREMLGSWMLGMGRTEVCDDSLESCDDGRTTPCPL